MTTAGAEWIFALIVREIALHHNPYVVLKILKHSGKYIVLAIAAVIISFGTGAFIMHLIDKHASQKEINEALALVNSMKGREI